MGSATVKRHKRGAGHKGGIKKGGTGGNRVSFPVGVKHREHTLAGHRFTQLLIDGKWRTYLNADVPRDREKPTRIAAPVRTALCPQCHFAYSHLMRRLGQICVECQAEEIAQREAWLAEQLGVADDGQDQERMRALSGYVDRDLGDRWDRGGYWTP